MLRAMLLRFLAVGSLVVAASTGCQHGGESDSSHGAVSSGEWLKAPNVDPSLAVPAESRRILAHAVAAGTQNYTCSKGAADGGTQHTWSFAGPEATLNGAGGTPMGKHFASSGGPAAPQWETLDGTFVVGKKVAAFTPPAKGDIPWLLLHVESHGGSGPLAQAQYVHRVNTHGGVAPSMPCDDAHLGKAEKVPYTADYFFYGP